MRKRKRGVFGLHQISLKHIGFARAIAFERAVFQIEKRIAHRKRCVLFELQARFSVAAQFGVALYEERMDVGKSALEHAAHKGRSRFLHRGIEGGKRTEGFVGRTVGLSVFGSGRSVKVYGVRNRLKAHDGAFVAGRIGAVRVHRVQSGAFFSRCKDKTSAGKPRKKFFVFARKGGFERAVYVFDAGTGKSLFGIERFGKTVINGAFALNVEDNVFSRIKILFRRHKHGSRRRNFIDNKRRTDGTLL